MRFWTTEQHGHVAVATFSNPPYNFVTREVLDELGQVVAGCEDPATRAVVVRSDPQSPAGFASYSVEELFGIASDPERSRYSADLGRSLKANLDRLTALPKVTIAALNGNALGGSFELTLACDLRIGQHGDFRYGNPEVRAGVIPGGGGTQRVTRLVGLARALDWVLRGRIVTPEVAFELGLVHEVVDDAAARALELAERDRFAAADGRRERQAGSLPRRRRAPSSCV